jgi:hypothetical protein
METIRTKWSMKLNKIQRTHIVQTFSAVANLFRVSREVSHKTWSCLEGSMNTEEKSTMQSSTKLKSHCLQHLPGKSNGDVKTFFFDSTIVDFFPRGLQNIFSNLKVFMIYRRSSIIYIIFLTPLSVTLSEKFVQRSLSVA